MLYGSAYLFLLPEFSTDFLASWMYVGDGLISGMLRLVLCSARRVMGECDGSI